MSLHTIKALDHVIDEYADYLRTGLRAKDPKLRTALFLVHSALRLTCNHSGYAPLWRDQVGDAWRESGKPPMTWPVLAGDDERWAVRAAIDAVVADAYGLSRDQYAHVLSTFSHTSYGPPFPSEVNTLEDPPIDFRSVKEDEIEIDNLLGVYRLDAHEKSLSTNVMGRLIDLYWHKLDNNTLHQRLRSYQGLREILQSLS